MPNPNEQIIDDIDNLDADNLNDDPNKVTDDNQDAGDNKDQQNQDDAQDDGNDQIYVSDEEYLAPYYAQGMPQNIKDLDSAMQWAVGLAKGQNAPSPVDNRMQELNRILASKGFYGGVDQFLASGGNMPNQNFNQPTHQFNQNQNQQSFLPENPYQQTIDAEIKAGLIKQENVGQYQQYASLNDRVLKQITTPVVNTMKQMFDVLRQHDVALKNAEYRMLPRKIRDNVSKQDLDTVLDSGYANNYEEAFIAHSRLKNPQLLADYFGGKGNGNMNSNGRRPQSMSRQNISQRQNQQQRQGQSAGQNIDKYILPDGRVNEAALDKLKPEEAMKMRHEILRKANSMR